MRRKRRLGGGKEKEGLLMRRDRGGEGYHRGGWLMDGFKRRKK